MPCKSAPDAPSAMPIRKATNTRGSRMKSNISRSVSLRFIGMMILGPKKTEQDTINSATISKIPIFT
jgi:hypothetical protein